MKDTKQETKLVPKLRFKEFEGKLYPNSLPLGKYVVSHNAGIYKKKELYGEGVNIIGVSNLYDISSINGQIFNKVPLTSDETNSFSLDTNDLLYGESSLVREGIAKTVYCTEKGKSTAFAWHTRRYKVNSSELFSPFLYYQLNSWTQRKYIMSVATQTALTGITTTDYFSTPIYVPTLPEQQKIASFLTLIDKRIELLTKKKKLLEEYKKGVMQKIFNQEVRFKDENGNDFPEWEEKRLGDLLKEYDQRTIDNNQFSILSSTAKGLFTQSEYFNHQVASSNNIGYKILKRGQLVFSPQNLWLGNININDKYDIGIVSPSYKVFDIRNNLISPQYMQELIKLPRMLYEYTISSEQGASVVRRNLNMELFEQIRINTPVIPEQKKIVEFSHKLNNQITNLAELLQGVQIYKQALLQQMFI